MTNGTSLAAAGGSTRLDVPPFVGGRQGPVNAPSMRAT